MFTKFTETDVIIAMLDHTHEWSELFFPFSSDEEYAEIERRALSGDLSVL
jgi:hypothetical protein